MGKSSKHEVERRVRDVATMVIDGASRSAICGYAREKWGVSDSQADRYTKRARELIRDEFADDVGYEHALARRRLDRLYGRSLEAGDLRTALAVVRAVVELEGLEGGKGVREHSGADLGFYSVLKIIADAVRAVCSPAQAREIVRRTGEMGARFEVPAVPDYEERSMRSADLELAVHDMETLGRTRTRKELIEDGVFDAMPPDDWD